MVCVGPRMDGRKAACCLSRGHRIQGSHQPTAEQDIAGPRVRCLLLEDVGSMAGAGTDPD